jgi:hypothetical protein
MKATASFSYSLAEKGISPIAVAGYWTDPRLSLSRSSICRFGWLKQQQHFRFAVYDSGLILVLGCRGLLCIQLAAKQHRLHLVLPGGLGFVDLNPKQA